MIQAYSFKWVGEIARAVGTAALAYLAAAIHDGGVPSDQAGWVSLLIGAIPVLYAAIRAALNYTPATPGGWTAPPAAPPPGP